MGYIAWPDRPSGSSIAQRIVGGITECAPRTSTRSSDLVIPVKPASVPKPACCVSEQSRRDIRRPEPHGRLAPKPAMVLDKTGKINVALGGEGEWNQRKAESLAAE